jgi:hypothetical protein
MTKTLTEYCALAGSSATTSRGQIRAAVNYLRCHRRRRPSDKFAAIGIDYPDNRRPGFWRIYTTYPSERGGRGSHRPKLTQVERDTRRCAKDAAFRRKFMAGLAREAARLLKAPALDTCAAVTAAADGRAMKNVRLQQIYALREKITGKKVEGAYVPKVESGILLDVPEKLARKAGAHIIMTGKDATLTATRRTSHGYHVAAETEWKNGKPVGYTRATHNNYVRCFALILDAGQALEVCVHTRETRHVLPDGYAWEQDGNGLRIFERAEPDADYHPDADELFAGSAEKMLLRLQANREKRIAAARVGRAFERDLATTRVTLADSRRAGNCIEGTLAFAERKLGLPRAEVLTSGFSVPAKTLLRVANGDKSRVEAAIRVAWTRETMVAI